MRKCLLLLALIFSAHVCAKDAAIELIEEHAALQPAILVQVAQNNQALQKQWIELTDTERAVLAPLGGVWDTLRPWQRERMLDIAKDYHKMDKRQQQLVQKRLNSWSRMTPYERENARKRFQKFKSLSPAEKDKLKKKWEAYQELPEAEREKLRKESSEIYDDPSLN